MKGWYNICYETSKGRAVQEQAKEQNILRVGYWSTVTNFTQNSTTETDLLPGSEPTIRPLPSTLAMSSGDHTGGDEFRTPSVQVLGNNPSLPSVNTTRCANLVRTVWKNILVRLLGVPYHWQNVPSSSLPGAHGEHNPFIHQSSVPVMLLCELDWPPPSLEYHGRLCNRLLEHFSPWTTLKMGS